jgi:Stage II sporulation protein E (SpoIIE)
VVEGPQDSTVLVVGDVVGHGLQAARRAAFIRTTFAATAPFSDDCCRLLSRANTALIERAGVSVEFVTAACVTYLPSAQTPTLGLRWPSPALELDDGHELIAPNQGTPLGLHLTHPRPGHVRECPSRTCPIENPHRVEGRAHTAADSRDPHRNRTPPAAAR